jgi:hypothetical protein
MSQTTQATYSSSHGPTGRHQVWQRIGVWTAASTKSTLVLDLKGERVLGARVAVVGIGQESDAGSRDRPAQINCQAAA